jgi:hypothetical protein
MRTKLIYTFRVPDLSSRSMPWSHHRAVRPINSLLALGQITHFLLPTARSRALYNIPHANDLQPLLTLIVPPFQLLRHPTVLVEMADTPLSSTHLDHALIAREVELGQENLGWRILCRRTIGSKAHSECVVPQVEARLKKLPSCGDRGRSDVGFCGAVAGRSSEFRGV